MNNATTTGVTLASMLATMERLTRRPPERYLIIHPDMLDAWRAMVGYHVGDVDEYLYSQNLTVKPSEHAPLRDADGNPAAYILDPNHLPVSSLQAEWHAAKAEREMRGDSLRYLLGGI